MPAIEDILHKKMDRKEFLVYMGLLFLAVSGIKNILSALSTSTASTVKPTSPDSFGYGPYGGTKKGGTLNG